MNKHPTAKFPPSLSHTACADVFLVTSRCTSQMGRRLECRQQQIMNHSVIMLPFTRFEGGIAITLQCWQWCTKLAWNLSDYVALRVLHFCNI